MAHRMYDTGRTMLIAADAMGAGRAQTRRMLEGAAALRAASQDLAVAIERRAATLDRLAASEERLARAKSARAALRA